MLHGAADSETGCVQTQHRAYGVVEWQVEFGLVVWLETTAVDSTTGSNTSAHERVRVREEEGHGASMVLVYHFPDVDSAAARHRKAVDDRTAGE